MSEGGNWQGPGWDLQVSPDGLEAHVDGRTIEVGSGDLARVEVERRWFRWHLRLGGDALLALRGVSKPTALQIRDWLAHAVLRPKVDAAVNWHRACADRLAAALDEQRWIAREAVDGMVASRPAAGLERELRDTNAWERLDADEQEAVARLDRDVAGTVAEANEAIMAAELRDRAEFFESIERSPLTDEQARAVVCFDNRVQVLAAAGSGKTSVMVARAAYAVARGFVGPERILLLAFNTAAAQELQTRVQDRLAAAGIDSRGITASTFHSFGLQVIGRATGAKPRLGRWLDGGRDVAKVLEIVDDLRDRDRRFRRSWDLYRMIYGPASNDVDGGRPDVRDTQAGRSAFRTFNGEVVASEGERVIANWLYLSGVRYDYERDYVVDLATEERAQYRPDFYYPDVDVWHEHWALDRNGKPPEEFVGYQDGIDWKRRQHAAHQTTLIESTWAEVMDGVGLDQLEDDLSSHGVGFDWNPDRPIRDQWATPLKHEDLARLVRTFMTHVKASGVTRDQLADRLEAGHDGLARQRTRVFLDIYWKIHDEWQRALAADNSIDFEDMLATAAEHLESGTLDIGYELILVDEFQDASRARARLVRGLVARPGRYLLAVGDDWQSINRFAGADLSVMTSFADWFGPGPQLALTTTFRCTQTICDVARAFIAKNPSQFAKPMISAHGPGGPPVQVIAGPDPARTLDRYLHRLSGEIAAGDAPAGTGPTTTVDVLGRYRFDRDVMPPRTPANLSVTFRTVHSAKGLEADYVVLPKLVTGAYGFPSTIADDPVLALAMPAPDTYPDAEERRLFYVALTRARHQVVILTDDQRMSPFVTEIITDGVDTGLVATSGIETGSVQMCARCGSGRMVLRKGPYGVFLGCTRFPACDNTIKTDKRNGPPCPACEDGTMVSRKGRYGGFLGCSNYPRCTNTRNVT